MGKNTEMIDARLEALTNDIFKNMYSEEQISKEIVKKNRNEIKGIIEDLVLNQPTFRQYVNESNCINEKESEDKIREAFVEAFEKRGFVTDIFAEFEEKYISEISNRYNKNEITKEEYESEVIQVIQDVLDKPALNIERNTVIAIAFGMNMSAMDTEEYLLEKALLEQGFNGKDYREVIFWWCLDNDFESFDKPMSKCIKAKELFEIYSDDKKLKELSENSDKDFEINDTVRTTLLSNDEMKYIENESDLIKYLYCLKKANLERKTSLNLSEVYEKLLHRIPYAHEYSSEKLQYYIWRLFAGVKGGELDALVLELGNEYKVIIDSLEYAKEKSVAIAELRKLKGVLEDDCIENIRDFLLKDEKKLYGLTQKAEGKNRRICKYSNRELKDYLYQILSGKTKSEVEDLAEGIMNNPQEYTLAGEHLENRAYYQTVKDSYTEFGVSIDGKKLKASQIKAISDLIWEETNKNYDEESHTRDEIIRSIVKQRNDIKKEVDEGLYEGELLQEMVLERIFSGIVITPKALRKRINFAGEGKDSKKKDKGVFYISRKELLFAYFLDKTVELVDCENKDIRRKHSVEVFEMRASKFLMDNYMYPIYKRNPFDVFILLCMMYEEDPFSYFMANWSLVDMEETKRK